MATRKRDQSLYRTGLTEKGFVGLRLRMPPHVHAELKLAQANQGHQSLNAFMSDYLEAVEPVVDIERLPIPRMVTKSIRVKNLLVYVPAPQAAFINSVKDAHGYSPAAAIEALRAACSDPWSVRDQLTMFDILGDPVSDRLRTRACDRQSVAPSNHVPAAHGRHGAQHRKPLVAP